MRRALFVATLLFAIVGCARHDDAMHAAQLKAKWEMFTRPTFPFTTGRNNVAFVCAADGICTVSSFE